MNTVKINFGEVVGGKMTIDLYFRSDEEGGMDSDDSHNICNIFREFLREEGWGNIRERSGMGTVHYDVTDPSDVNLVKNRAVDVLSRELPEIFFSVT